MNFYSDLSNIQTARTAGEVGRICAEVVYGYQNAAANKEFSELRAKVDASLAGSRLAKDRAAEAVQQMMIPEALDYPL